MSALSFDVNDAPPPLEPIESIKARADIVDVIGRYCALKKMQGDYWACCPLHSERTPSFKVSEARQSFYCFGCGAKGDVFDFVMAAEGVTLPVAIERLLDIVGGGAADPATLAAQAARRASAARQEAQEAAQRTALARRIWSESEYLTRRSDPLAVAYLVERRGIAMWNSYSLRWHPRCPWGTGTSGCIIAPVENADGEMTAIWRIRPVMEGKVERKGLGPIQGCFAPVIDHAGLEVLTVAEGVEDALSAWVLATYPAWAALSAGNMAALRLPEQFRQIIICADQDPGGQGLANARTLAGRLRAEGREARVIVPTEHKDANDVLRGRAA